MASFLLGEKLKKKRLLEKKHISWKQGSFLGFGGDKTVAYVLYEYEVTSKGKDLPVYIQDGYQVPEELEITSALQYGMNKGVFFLVYHDKAANTPYQHRFVQNDFQRAAYQVNNFLNTYSKGVVDVSWIAGDYLRNF